MITADSSSGVASSLACCQLSKRSDSAGVTRGRKIKQQLSKLMEGMISLEMNM